MSLKAQVLDVLAGRWPVYRLEERWEKYLPCERLLGVTIHPSDIDDTNVGRNMDRMFRAGCAKVFERCACARSSTSKWR